MAQTTLPEMPAGPVMELYGQRKRFSVPVGLKCLLEEISREVLRMQPTNISEFIADYLEAKLSLQCNNGGKERRKSWEVTRWSWQGSSILSDADLLEFLSEFHLTFFEATRLAIIIQAAYRGFKDRLYVKQKRASITQEDVDLNIEYDGEDAYTVVECDGTQTHFTADDVENILRNYNLTLEKANQYAVKIQQTFRGYRTRESFARHFPALAMRLQAIDKTLHTKDKKKIDRMETETVMGTLHRSATTIQRAFRGYKHRKHKHPGMTESESEMTASDYSFGRSESESELEGLSDDELNLAELKSAADGSQGAADRSMKGRGMDSNTKDNNQDGNGSLSKTLLDLESAMVINSDKVADDGDGDGYDEEDNFEDEFPPLNLEDELQPQEE